MITSEYPTPENPTAVPFISRQVDFLTRAGVDVDVFHFKGNKNPFNYIRAWRRLHKYAKQKDYDLVHAQWGQSATLALPKSVPWIITFRGNDLEGIVDEDGKITFLGKIQRLVSKAMAGLADERIVVSESLGRHLRGHNYRVIPSGLDLELFRPIPIMEAREKLGLSPDKRLILFAASTIDNPRKRYGLARSAVEILKRRLDAELVVATQVSHRLIPYFMNACDALLLTSIHEGSPNVVKEALACDLPVVSVDVGDVAERIRSVEGCILCHDDSPEAIANALAQVLIRNERVRGRQTVQELDERQTAMKVIAIYHKTLAKQKQKKAVLKEEQTGEPSPSRT
jgi:glycosyltransferase involved in cell wall biosynthesis